MKAFRFARVAAVADAVGLATSEESAAFVAGGTELLNLMRDGIVTPDLVVDVNAVPLGGLDWRQDGLRIGALARMTDVARDQTVRQRFPLLSQALLASASAQVRNMASIGGNLMQRTRCWYFRDAALPCNTRVAGSGCPAIAGENRWHAILGGSDACIKVHPSDLAVALMALDAQVLIHAPEGERRVPIAEFYLLPGTTPHLETVLRRDELIVGVDLPVTPAAARSRYVKVRDRASFEFALVSVAAALEIVGGVVRDVRLALGGVAPKPWRASAAESELRGRQLSAPAIEAASRAAVLGATPREHNGFKVELVRRVLASTLTELGGGA